MTDATTAPPDWRPPGHRGWRCDYNPAYTEVHLRPRNDLIWHPLDDDCACGPTTSYVVLDGPGPRWFVVHHALDGRPVAPPGTYEPAPGPCGGRHGDDGVTA